MTITNPSEYTRRAVYNAQLQSILSDTVLNIRLAFQPPKVTMGRFNVRIDEYDVDFDDTRDHAVLRWKEMVLGACESLSSAVDRQTVQEPRNWEAVTEDIQERANGPTCNATTRRILLGIQPLPRTLFNLSDTFTTALAPHDIELNILWGLLFLNIKVGPRTDALRLFDCAVLTMPSSQWSHRISSEGQPIGFPSCGGPSSGLLTAIGCVIKSKNQHLQ